MVSTVPSLGLNGLSGYPVSVECDLSMGYSGMEIVGLPDTAVREARDRVRSALGNSGLRFPHQHLTINLAPADRRKEGTLYDLPMLVSILRSSGQIPPLPEGCAFLGELALTGMLRPVRGVLPMALCAREQGFHTLFLPAENAREATLAEGLTVYPVEDVTALVEHLTGATPLDPAAPWVPEEGLADGPDFSDVKGQEPVKRAAEIAAAGGHHLLMVGPPGSGKSMLAKRIPSILPRMTREEALEVTGLMSVAGLLDPAQPLALQRPFRSPHHTISSTALAGGGTALRPGEVSLASHGILFLDELPEFSRDTLEVLRQPLEDGQVQISRVSGTVVYPSRFMLVCAMNPCKCGWYGHESGRCRCSAGEVARYLSRLSGPLLDRIDLQVEVPALSFEELERRQPGESSAQLRERVERARDLQRRRYSGSSVTCNAQMGQRELREFCRLDEAGSAVMKGAFERMGLTARSYDRLLRVARTIADLEGAEQVSALHLAEAIGYRTARGLMRP